MRGAADRGIAYAVASAAGFGALGVLGGLGHAHGFTTSTMLAWRFLGAAAILAVLELARGATPRLATGPLVLGAVGYAAQSLLFFRTVDRIGPGKAAILLYSYPALVALLAWARHRRRPSRGHLLALAITTVGCVLVLDTDDGAFSTPGVALGLATAAVYALYLVISEHVLRAISPLTSAFNVALGAGLVMTGLAALEPGPRAPGTATELGIVAALIAVCTVLPTLALFAAIHRIGAARAALCSTVEPMVATALGAAIAGERFTPPQLVGGALVVSSIAVMYVTDRLPHEQEALS